MIMICMDLSKVYSAFHSELAPASPVTRNGKVALKMDGWMDGSSENVSQVCHLNSTQPL